MNYTKQDCIEGLRRAASECGEPLQVQEWRDGDYSPSDRTLANKFGSWNEAKEAAGLNVIPCGENSDFVENMNTGGRRRVGCLYRTDKRGYETWAVHNITTQHRVAVHRLVAVAEYGVEAVAGNVVHHKNGCTYDNRVENLEVLDRAEHARHHIEAGDVEIGDGGGFV